MNKLEYDKRLGELIRKANAIRSQFTEGKYFNYLKAVRQISEFRRGVRMKTEETCDTCQGTGKKKDSTGFFQMICDQCKGLGVLDDVLTIPVERHKTEYTPLSI